MCERKWISYISYKPGTTVEAVVLARASTWMDQRTVIVSGPAFVQNNCCGCPRSQRTSGWQKTVCFFNLVLNRIQIRFCYLRVRFFGTIPE